MDLDREHESIVRWLATATAYPNQPADVEHIETHISDVFMAGAHVYKLKKPVCFDFLDFSSVQKREWACREELRLNRRLAADTYLDVLPITRAENGRYEINGTGTVVDWLVHMRRLPVEMTLEARLRRGELQASDIERLAKTLVRFYQSLPPVAWTPAEYHRRYLAHVRSNLRELLTARHHLPRGVVERVHGFQLQLLLLKPELLEQRAMQRRVVDGHGDLRPEHICLAEQVSIFDCIEFSADFRSIDAADELAFLAAECDYLEAEWVAGQLFQTYQEESGDRPADVLLDFYKCYRACVRAKVAALRADQVSGPEQIKFIAEAAQRLALANRYALRWLQPLVLVVGGVAGTGKSTLARALADELGAECLRTDVVRREMFGTKPRVTALDQGIYEEGQRDRVYQELVRRAGAVHAEQISVVLDGTFSRIDWLQRAKAIVKERGIWLAIECVCSPDIARERIQHRAAVGDDPSEAHSEVHQAQCEQWESWPRDTRNIRIDTTSPLEKQLRCVMAELQTLTGDPVASRP